jgi:hypothetical protein
MDATRLLIEAITGHSTVLFRAPFNADFEPGVIRLRQSLIYWERKKKT